MTRCGDRLLEQQAPVAERLDRFGRRRTDGRGQVRRRRHETHAAATATGRGLDHDRKADAGRFTLERGGVLRLAVVAGHDRYSGRGHALARTRLVAHRRDRVRRRTDEHQPGTGHGAREVRVLGQEAVAGMDRVGARRTRCREDPVDAQVTLGRRFAAERDRLVTGGHMAAATVGIRVHGDRRDSHASRRARDPGDDLATVGHQQASQRHHVNSGRSVTAQLHAGARRSRLAAMPSCAAPVRNCLAKSRAAASSAAGSGSSRLRETRCRVARSAAGSAAASRRSSSCTASCKRGPADDGVHESCGRRRPGVEPRGAEHQPAGLRRAGAARNERRDLRRDHAERDFGQRKRGVVRRDHAVHDRGESAAAAHGRAADHAERGDRQRREALEHRAEVPVVLDDRVGTGTGRRGQQLEETAEVGARAEVTPRAPQHQCARAGVRLEPVAQLQQRLRASVPTAHCACRAG